MRPQDWLGRHFSEKSVLTSRRNSLPPKGRLELAEIEIQAGNAKKGRALLRQLADDAEKRGFRLIAQRATADSTSLPIAHRAISRN